MGYKIMYETDMLVKQVSDEKRVNYIKRLIVPIVIVLMVSFCLWRMRGYLVPGDPAVTKAAVRTLQQQIRDGENVGNVFATFCREIVAGAELS